MSGYSSLTAGEWQCMVCRAQRPYELIDVAHRPMRGFEDMFPGTRVNLRYCVDNPACVATAHESGTWPAEGVRD